MRWLGVAGGDLYLTEGCRELPTQCSASSDKAAASLFEQWGEY